MDWGSDEDAPGYIYDAIKAGTHVVVPVEPTKLMMLQFIGLWANNKPFKLCYRAMIAAAKKEQTDG